MEFEDQLRMALAEALREQRSTVVVRSMRVLSIDGSRVFMVNYDLEGHMASPARFTFAFEEDFDLRESIAAFRDFCERNWATAGFAPEPPRAVAKAFSAAGD